MKWNIINLLRECPRVAADATYNANIFYLLIRETTHLAPSYTQCFSHHTSFTTNACVTRQARVHGGNLHRGELSDWLNVEQYMV
jgi:hypothetical protein